MGHYILRRTLSAPKERVYDFFVDPVAFSHWFVVPGFTTPRTGSASTHGRAGRSER